MMRIGLISDTHGLLRPQALAFLHGCDHILHAGDIGDPAILAALARIAPVTAVRGNNDHGDWADALPACTDVVFERVRIHLLHDLAGLAIDPRAAAVHVVVSGHSHRPSIEHHAGILHVNPGSAGRRRFRLPIALGELHIDDAIASPRIVELDGAAA
ncbi:MAG TPA: metallophosphoesterase family protein [Dokdonella sp.]|nr:metallophosphoesterase family protein [Dokdonella sp.]